MNTSRIVTSAATGLATAWLTDQAMKRTSLPPAARPFVGMAVTAAVTAAVRRLQRP